jgi:hypothetical protein
MHSTSESMPLGTWPHSPTASTADSICNHRLQSPGYLCPPRARSSVCRQIVSGKTSRLSHVRPEMQSWGAHLAATRRISPARHARIRFPQRAASTLCGKPGVAAGGLSGIASPVAFQHPIPNHFGIEARKRAARVVREGVRAILRGQQPVEDLHPCGGADPRIEQSAQRLVQQAPVEPDEVIVRPRVAFARCFCSLGADRRRLSWPRAIGHG